VQSPDDFRRCLNMYVDVRLDPPAPPTLCDPDDLKSLKVVYHGDPSGLAAALSGLARMTSDGHALLDAESLIGLAGDRARDPRWRESFDAMVAYAREKGWVEERDGDVALQAHCEPDSK
jgi:hypothetical protein